MSASAVADMADTVASYRLRFGRDLADDDVEMVVQSVRAFEKDHRPIMGRRGRGPFAVRYRDEVLATRLGFPERDRRLVMFRCTPMPGSSQYGTAVYVLAQTIAGKLKTDVDVQPDNATAVARGL